MNTIKNIKSSTGLPEGIDLTKLRAVVVNNWFWLLLIFLVINATAYLYIRYTKNLYESEAVLKLDVKNDATDLGIKNVVEDQNVKLMSGEIELIHSRLFLSRVLDSSKLEVSYFSVGRVLNEELFGYAPFVVTYRPNQPSAYYNRPLFVEMESGGRYKIKVGNAGPEFSGVYGKPLKLDGLEVTLTKNNAFVPGDEIGYFFTVNTRDVLLDYLQRNLSADPLNYSANTIRVGFRDHNPFKARAILHTITNTYLHYSNEQKNLTNRQKIEWLSKELGQIEKKMEGFEDYFENFTLQHKSSDLDEDLARTIAQMTRVDSQRYDLTQRLANLNQLVGELEQGQYVLTMGQRAVLPSNLTKHLDDLQTSLLEQEKLKLSYKESTFAYQARQKEIETLRDQVVRQLREIRGEWQTRLKHLNKNKQALEAEFAGLPDKNTEFSKNMRFYKLNEQFYLMLMQSKSEFEIAQAGTTPDFKILTPATSPGAPITPKRTLIMGAAMVMSLVLNLLFVGVLYLLNNKITSTAELERNLDLPLLGVIPATRYSASETPLHVMAHPKSMLTESLRTLRTNLDFFHIQSPRKTIVISSTVSGEGKSFVAMNLGGVLALSRKKVILVDLDMRKKKLNLPDNLNSEHQGVSTVLIRKHTWQECIRPTDLETLHYLPAGPQPPNPSELLLNGEFESLLEELGRHYDYILLDTPPVGLVTDGIMAMKRADICIYIFRANYSHRDFVNNLQRIININKLTNITMLLNALPSGEKRYGYGYYEEPKQRHWIFNLFKR